jgi:hypothetical protein
MLGRQRIEAKANWRMGSYYQPGSLKKRKYQRRENCLLSRGWGSLYQNIYDDINGEMVS